MDSAQESDQQRVQPSVSELPDSLGEGTTLLLCPFDPTAHDLSLLALAEFGESTDTGVIVTTTRGVEKTIETYTALDDANAQPSICIVDTVSEQQSISAMYETVPTVFTPSAEDVERLVLALSDLTRNRTPDDGERHLVVPSLTPLLANASVSQITDVLDRITGLRTAGGFGLFGLDYTEHDESTVSAVASAVDRVLWVTKQADDEFAFELRSTRGELRELSVSKDPSE
ncbi:hypothetical protein ACFR9U_20375 [Halorientalis brevis]|uniref:Uncharacterized protein n=1 Tax=Halorientalis brevis TaxID=1126241 RepID=A0ABD6CJ73_9EURY|nr:hypothetical protein [Halorientalis brevis]